MQPTPGGGWFRRLANRVGRIITGRQPGPLPPTPTPIEDDYGDYGDRGDYIDYEPDDVYEEDEGWEPEEYGREIALYDANGELIGSNTKEGWFDELSHNPAEWLVAQYGYNNIDLIYALEAIGEWDTYDWETWSQIYHGIFGE